ncbi:YdiK family protein [Jeotgalibacillus aurantiacus]|uniref:YdiK family protein n=1 Tax=Jeotgalibacillus aurantiacus TaxID=2763266 RepID=UPI001D09C373|nr:YdiK family protein [Jeotgalibacillus aurantiacus]
MRSPLGHGVFYLILGFFFVFFAINSVNENGWGVWAYIFVAFATYDIGAGIRLIGLHLKIKKHMNEKK